MRATGRRSAIAPSKRKDRRPTREMGLRISRASSIAPRSGPIVRILKVYGDSRPLRSPGRAMWSRSATAPDRRQRRPTPSVWSRSIEAAPARPSIRWPIHCGYEASAEVTAFSSKYDAVLAGKAKFTAQEQTGYDLFRASAVQFLSPRRRAWRGPLFTDFTASNIGTTPIGGFLTMQKAGPMRSAMSPIRRSVIRRWRRRSFLARPCAQPTFRGGCPMAPLAPANQRECRCRHYATSTSGEPGFREGLWHNGYSRAEGDRPFLQHARCPAALPAA